MYIQLIDYTSGVAQVMASIRMDGDQMIVDGVLPPPVQDELDAARERVKSPTLFLNSLPFVFSGSYLRAKRVFDRSAQVLKGGPGSGRYPRGSGRRSQEFGKPLHQTELFKSLRQADGGFTYDALTGKLKNTGYALSIHEDRQLIMPSNEVNLKALIEYAVENKDLLSQSQKYLGGWNNPKDGKVYLDVSTIVKTPEEAQRLGKQNHQISYFDFALGKSVDIVYDAHEDEHEHKTARETNILRGWAGRRPPDVRSDGGVDGEVDREIAHSGRDSRSTPNLGQVLKGGTGSGNFGHQGRLGEVGGSGGGLAGDSGRGTAVSETPKAVALPPRPVPNEEVQSIANVYTAAHGMAPIDHSTYLPVFPAKGREIAAAYDALPVDDSQNPVVKEAYGALVKETTEQYAFATAHGMTFTPWTKEGQPYASSVEMAADVRNNHRLFFFTGGEPHPFLSTVDPKTGLTANDEFRAVHDYFGHSAGGYGFGPRGEENAWAVHSQMFSLPARRAMTAETRGQNSWVNFGAQNYDVKGNYKNIPATEKPYAVQKVAVLPEKYVDRTT